MQCALGHYTWQARLLGGLGGMSPRNLFWISDLLRSFLDDLLIIVFKCLQNLKVWLRFAPQRLQSSCEVRKKKENFS